MLYQMTEMTCDFYGRKLHQIKALKDLPKFGVLSGDLGGWIEKESNLPQNSEAWIFPRAKVCGFSVMHGGEMHGGEMWGGVMHGGEMWGGEMHGGVMHGGVMHGGEMHGGEMRGGVMRGGEMRGGEMRGGVMRGGVMRGGEMRGGEMRGGVMRGGVMTHDALFIAGLCWLITINDSQMTIGCQSHDLRKWWKYSDATIAKMDPAALAFWHANKDMLKAICAATGRHSGSES